ncbi:MAG: sugar phosphate isomerase/epimerase family protein, partial [Promethearchaeota archaeon]
MKITYAISNWIYGSEPIERAFQRLKKYNYDAIEIMVEDPSRFDIKKIEGLMEKHDLPCCSVCTMMTGAAPRESRRNLIDADEQVQKQTIEYLKSCLDIGNSLEAKLVLTVPS